MVNKRTAQLEASYRALQIELDEREHAQDVFTGIGRAI